VKDVTVHRLALKSRERVPGTWPQLEITVVATTVDEAAATLTTVARLWRGLNAKVTVLLPVVVQFPAPLSQPPVSPDFLERQLRLALAGHIVGRIEIEVLFCRDRIEAVRDALKPHSVVVLGGRKWGLLILARALRKAGYSVVFAR
jgi:hypothetical protein